MSRGQRSLSNAARDLIDSNDPSRGDVAEAAAREHAIEPIRGIMPAIYERLRALMHLEPGWDYHEGKALSPVSIGNAVDLLVDLAHQRPAAKVENLCPFVISPLGDGGIQLEWRQPLSDLEIEIHPQGEYSYLLTERHGLERRFEEVEKASPSEILELLSRILVDS